MTGYGKAMATYGDKKIFAEIRSLNSKALDLSTRIAPLYREKEMEIRAIISKALERGKVDFNLWVEKEASEAATPINGALVANYYAQIKDVATQYGIPQPADWFATLLRMPDVMTRVEVQELSDEEWAVARGAVEEAVLQLVDFRKQEGEALARKFSEKLDNIAALMKAIEPYEAERVQKIRDRIVESLQKLPVEYDKNRLEQELIYYIEKLDINEEKVRLRQHCRYFLDTISNEPNPGKKLGFIAQEMGREINTTGSKANHTEIQKIVVKMKDELEKIKEQSLNIL